MIFWGPERVTNLPSITQILGGKADHTSQDDSHQHPSSPLCSLLPNHFWM